MKIDVSTIEGYDLMTPEQKLQALEAFEYDVPQPDYSGYIKKADFDKASSELADMKRKYNAMLSEDEQKKQAHEEEMETLRRKVASMEQETRLADLKASYISMGYEETLATDTAQATLEGDNARVFSNMKKFLEAHDKAIEAKMIAETPRPSGAGAKGEVPKKTRAEIEAIEDTTERRQAMKDNLDLFPELLG